jgi:hypothetical protein
MAILTASTSMRAITLDTSTPMDARDGCSSAPVTSSCSAQSRETPALSGADSSMTAGKKASTALSSATRASTYRHPSFAKRMQSLMQSGLIAGITPTSIAKRSPQRTLAIASSWLDGSDAASQQAEN